MVETCGVAVWLISFMMSLLAMDVKAVVGVARYKLDRNYLTIKYKIYYIVVSCQYVRSVALLSFEKTDIFPSLKFNQSGPYLVTQIGVFIPKRLSYPEQSRPSDTRLR
jgi:hypothetical protein